MDKETEDLTSDGVSVHSGFPNPSDQNLSLDLNQLVIKHPSSTYLFKISGHSWSDQGIHDGDVAVIDRSLSRRPTDLVIAWQTSGFTIIRGSQLTSDEAYWGVISTVIHQYERD